ncbi:hypothetical protein MRX96_009027 [Rhipicephalus microplus]
MPFMRALSPEPLRCARYVTRQKNEIGIEQFLQVPFSIFPESIARCFPQRQRKEKRLLPSSYNADSLRILCPDRPEDYGQSSFCSSRLTLSSSRCNLTTHSTVTVTKPVKRNHCTATTARRQASTPLPDVGGQQGGPATAPRTWRSAPARRDYPWSARGQSAGVRRPAIGICFSWDCCFARAGSRTD